MTPFGYPHPLPHKGEYLACSMSLVSQRFAPFGRCRTPDNGRFPHGSRDSRSHDQRQSKPAVGSSREPGLPGAPPGAAHTTTPPPEMPCSRAPESRGGKRGKHGRSWKVKAFNVVRMAVAPFVQRLKEKRARVVLSHPDLGRTRTTGCSGIDRRPCSVRGDVLYRVLYPQARLGFGSRVVRGRREAGEFIVESDEQPPAAAPIRGLARVLDESAVDAELLRPRLRVNVHIMEDVTRITLADGRTLKTERSRKSAGQLLRFTVLMPCWPDRRNC